MQLTGHPFLCITLRTNKESLGSNWALIYKLNVIFDILIAFWFTFSAYYACATVASDFNVQFSIVLSKSWKMLP